MVKMLKKINSADFELSQFLFALNEYLHMIKKMDLEY